MNDPARSDQRQRLLEAEALQLARGRSDPASPYFAGGQKAHVGRRRFLDASL